MRDLLDIINNLVLMFNLEPPEINSMEDALDFLSKHEEEYKEYLDSIISV